jgi:hypothetical protein
MKVSKNNFKTKIFSFFTATILIYGFVYFGHQKVFGQESAGFNVEVSPGKVNLTINPGDNYVQTFRIGNYSGGTKTFYIYVRDFTVINESGTPTFFENGDLNDEARKFALSQWVKLPSESVVVENNQTKEVNATISVPENAEAGGHYGAFFVQTQAPDTTGTAVESIGRIASLMLVNVPGDVTENIVITKAQTDKQVYWQDNPNITFTTYLKNEGNVHGIPVGAFNISGGYGAKNKSVIYNQNQGAVLPGAPERKISEAFKLDKKGSLIPPIGKFTLELVARYGTDNLPLETTISFWLLPAKFIAVSLLSAVVVLFVLWRALVSFRK